MANNTHEEMILELSEKANAEIIEDHGDLESLFNDLVIDAGKHKIFSTITYMATYNLDNRMPPMSDTMWEGCKIDALNFVQELAELYKPLLSQKIVDTGYYDGEVA